MSRTIRPNNMPRCDEDRERCTCAADGPGQGGQTWEDVMKVRDESVPPPGWVTAESLGVPPITASGKAMRAEQRAMITIEEAWRIYDEEHGYAPTDEQREQRALAAWNGE